MKKQTKNHIHNSGFFHFINEANGRVLVYPDNLSLEQSLRHNAILKHKVQTLQYTIDIKRVINQSAVHIRDEIKYIPKTPWPPKPDEVDADYVELPETLLLFLRHLLIGHSVEGTPRLCADE